MSAITRAKMSAGPSELVANHVGVHAERDRRVGVSEPGGDDMTAVRHLLTSGSIPRAQIATAVQFLAYLTPGADDLQKP